MSFLKRIIYVLLGTFCLGLGVAFIKLSGLGQDALSALVFSIHYLIDLPFFSFTVCYLAVNSIFLILTIIFKRDKINIGSILNFALTGVSCDIFMYLLGLLNIESTSIVINLIYSLLGICIMVFGIALYGGANLGLAPYDVMPILINKVFKKISYGTSRIILDVTVAILALILGVIILGRKDIININTVLLFCLVGTILPYFSKFVNKYIIKNDDKTFE